ncbi:MAG: hypothetical protein ACOCTS_03315 [Thermodesulfobacteriota bacterium]
MQGIHEIVVAPHFVKQLQSLRGGGLKISGFWLFAAGFGEMLGVAGQLNGGKPAVEVVFMGLLIPGAVVGLQHEQDKTVDRDEQQRDHRRVAP